MEGVVQCPVEPRDIRQVSQAMQLLPIGDEPIEALSVCAEDRILQRGLGNEMAGKLGKEFPADDRFNRRKGRGQSGDEAVHGVVSVQLQAPRGGPWISVDRRQKIAAVVAGEMM